MEWTNETLTLITQAAAAAYTPKQTAYLIGCNVADLLAVLYLDDHPVNHAYFQGFYSSEMAIRESAFTLARNGSSPAQTLALKLFDDTRKTIMKDGQLTEI